ncbi:D-mannonate oxidoreductase [Shinella sp. SUS2]|jgi:tagaturonate reductase|uniref:mannitol dehydrogenase family protein n=1 Tax=unclassified Shinella TaxID=2643062 RepID=UPI00068050C1|nr:MULTISPECIES: D-mannonate oxidoreductase [unclassified Shinella]KNY15007.1 D-mannonate oxidoreductase [Shinella sp. SUS2]KOC74659.1 D-mannonate oxidoreductase [Shinella sp. GWS1]
MGTPILQFGTSRFLQAHADLFIDEALKRGEALGRITVIQTTGAPERAGRLAALAAPGGYPVIIRGRKDGHEVNREQRITSVARTLSAANDWETVRKIFCDEAEVVLSNTGDTGYMVGPDDLAGPVPASFPGKLLALLHDRFAANRRELTLLPCELVSRNGDVLKRLILDLQGDRYPESDFRNWLSESVIWGNTLVDRIVSEPLEPAGAIAEPYALWAIETQPGLTVPCRHADIRLVDDLTPYEKLKLHILNLGHTVLADIWLAEKRPKEETVKAILAEADVRRRLLAIYHDEVVPGFADRGLGREAEAYVAATLERFDNPFLEHRLSDIANHHAEKRVRRIGDFLAWAPGVPMPRLAAIAGGQ